MSDDIVFGTPETWIATGFFTPDYRPLAEKLSRQLQGHGTPHHFYAAPKVASWHDAIVLKPAFVRRALRDYPQCMALNLDMDCSVLGSLERAMNAISSGPADIRLGMMTKVNRKGWRCWYSSRVGVWHPTPGARLLADHWGQACFDQRRRPRVPLCDERALALTIAETPGVSIASLPDYLRGLDMQTAPSSALIVHDSAHDAARPMIGVKRRIKAWRRRLFIGVTTAVAE